MYVCALVMTDIACDGRTDTQTHTLASAVSSDTSLPLSDVEDWEVEAEVKAVRARFDCRAWKLSNEFVIE